MNNILLLSIEMLSIIYELFIGAIIMREGRRILSRNHHLLQLCEETMSSLPISDMSFGTYLHDWTVVFPSHRGLTTKNELNERKSFEQHKSVLMFGPARCCPLSDFRCCFNYNPWPVGVTLLAYQGISRRDSTPAIFRPDPSLDPRGLWTPDQSTQRVAPVDSSTDQLARSRWVFSCETIRSRDPFVPRINSRGVV